MAQLQVTRRRELGPMDDAPPQRKRAKRNYPRRNEARNEEIARLAMKEGVPLLEIASKFAIHVATVRHVLWKAGHSTRGLSSNYRGDNALSSKEMMKRDKDIVRKRKKGMTLQAIGDEYGITRERVRQILLRMGECAEGA